MAQAAVEEPLRQAFQQAEQLYHQGRYGEAFDAYRELVERRLDRRLAGVRPWEEVDLVLVERLSELCVLFGHFEAADLLLAAGVEINRQADDRYAADYLAVKRSQVLLGQGRVEDAFAQLTTLARSLGAIDRIELSPAGLELWEAGLQWPSTDRGDRQVLLASLYWVMGRILASNGRYGEALTSFGRGLVHTRDKAPLLARQAELPLRLDAAGALLEKGELDAAAARLVEVGSQIDQERNPGFYVRSVKLRGQLGRMRGELGEALDCFDEVRRFCRRLGFDHASRTARLNLAHVLILLNQTAEAESLALDVRVEAMRTGESAHQARAELLLVLSHARRQSFGEGAVAPAVRTMQHPASAISGEAETPEARPLDLPPASNFLTFFEERTLAFQWYRRAGDWAGAGQVLSQMEVTFADTDSALVEVRLAVLRGVHAYDLGEIHAAQVQLQSAARTLRALELRPELREVLLFLSSCRELSGAGEEARTLRREAEEILSVVAGSLSEALQGLYLIDKWSAAEEHLASEIDALVELKTRALQGAWILRPFRRWKVLLHLDALLYKLDLYRGASVVQTITGMPPENGSDLDTGEPAHGGSPRSLLRRLLTHPWNRASIGFLALPDRTLIVRATWLGLDFAVVPLTRVDLRHRVRRWYQSPVRAEGVGGGRNLPPDSPIRELAATAARWREVGEGLARALLLPAILKRLPRRVQALTILPDDVLHGFPFAALSHGGQFLGERYRLTVDHRPTAGRNRWRRPSCDQALVVGVARGTREIPPLPGTRPEVEAVERWAVERGFDTSPGPLLDDDASRESVLARLPKASLWHVACHGVFAPGHPEQTGLVLVPRPNEAEVLSLPDLARLPLHRLHHVTLSSCWAADNFVLPGRLVLSLPEVLRRGGAGSVLACLWKVDDEVARAFMSSFYRHLNEHPRDEALRRARAECIANRLGVKGVDTSHPYYWAGFNLYGDPGRLHFRSQVCPAGRFSSAAPPTASRGWRTTSC